MGWVNGYGLTTFEDIFDHIEDIGENDDPPAGYVRYVYTEDNGWIDLKHFFGALKYGEAVMDAVEVAQETDGSRSAFSYEDLPSNDFGGNFRRRLFKRGRKGNVLTDVQREGEELYDALGSYFEGAGSTAPENAPNWEQMPESRTRRKLPKFPRGTRNRDQKIRDLLSTGDYVPQNYSQEPYDLTDFHPARTSPQAQEEDEQ